MPSFIRSIIVFRCSQLLKHTCLLGYFKMTLRRMFYSKYMRQAKKIALREQLYLGSTI